MFYKRCIEWKVFTKVKPQDKSQCLIIHQDGMKEIAVFDEQSGFIGVQSNSLIVYWLDILAIDEPYVYNR